MDFKAFLLHIKEKVKTRNTDDKVHIVLGNESCDLDSAVSALVYAYFLYKQHHNGETVFIPVLNIPESDYRLRTEVTFVLKQLGINQEHLVFRSNINLGEWKSKGNLKLTLVDHNVLSSQDEEFECCVVEVVDHHKLERAGNFSASMTVEMVGSCSTLIAEKMSSSDCLNREISQILYSAIIMDTVCLSETAGRKTDKDVQMAKLLEGNLKQGVNERQQKFDELQKAKMDVSGLSCKDLLRKDTKKVNNANITVIISSVPLSLEEFLRKDYCLTDIRQVSAEHNCDVIIIMTLCIRDTEPCRQVAVYSDNTQLREKVLTVLRTSTEPFLDIGDQIPSEIDGIEAYHVENVKATRKYVLPLINDFLKQLDERGTLDSGISSTKTSFNISKSDSELSPQLTMDEFDIFAPKAGENVSSGDANHENANGTDQSVPVSNAFDEFDLLSGIVKQENANEAQKVGNSPKGSKSLDFDTNFDPFSTITETPSEENKPFYVSETLVDGDFVLTGDDTAEIEQGVSGEFNPFQQLKGSSFESNPNNDQNFDPFSSNVFDSQFTSNTTTLNDMWGSSDPFGLGDVSSNNTQNSDPLANHTNVLLEPGMTPDQGLSPEIRSRTSSQPDTPSIGFSPTATPPNTYIGDSSMSNQNKETNLSGLDSAEMVLKINKKKKTLDALNINGATTHESSTDSTSPLPNVPANSFADGNMDEFEKSHHLPSFNSADMLEKMQGKMADFGEHDEDTIRDRTKQDESDFPGFTPTQTPDDNEQELDDLPSFNSAEMLDRIEHARSSLTDVNPDDLFEAKKLPFTPPNSCMDSPLYDSGGGKELSREELMRKVSEAHSSQSDNESPVVPDKTFESDTFPDLTPEQQEELMQESKLIADQLTDELIEDALSSYDPNSASQNDAQANDYISNEDTSPSMDTHEVPVETDYLKSVDPLQGNVDLISDDVVKNENGGVLNDEDDDTRQDVARQIVSDVISGAVVTVMEDESQNNMFDSQEDLEDSRSDKTLSPPPVGNTKDEHLSAKDFVYDEQNANSNDRDQINIAQSVVSEAISNAAIKVQEEGIDLDIESGQRESKSPDSESAISELVENNSPLTETEVFGAIPYGTDLNQVEKEFGFDQDLSASDSDKSLLSENISAITEEQNNLASNEMGIIDMENRENSQSGDEISAAQVIVSQAIKNASDVVQNEEIGAQNNEEKEQITSSAYGKEYEMNTNDDSITHGQIELGQDIDKQYDIPGEFISDTHDTQQSPDNNANKEDQINLNGSEDNVYGDEEKENVLPSAMLERSISDDPSENLKKSDDFSENWMISDDFSENVKKSGDFSENLKKSDDFSDNENKADEFSKNMNAFKDSSENVNKSLSDEFLADDFSENINKQSDEFLADDFYENVNKQQRNDEFQGQVSESAISGDSLNVNVNENSINSFGQENLESAMSDRSEDLNGSGIASSLIEQENLNNVEVSQSVLSSDDSLNVNENIVPPIEVDNQESAIGGAFVKSSEDSSKLSDDSENLSEDMITSIEQERSAIRGDATQLTEQGINENEQENALSHGLGNENDTGIDFNQRDTLESPISSDFGNINESGITSVQQEMLESAISDDVPMDNSIEDVPMENSIEDVAMETSIGKENLSEEEITSVQQKNQESAISDDSKNEHVPTLVGQENVSENVITSNEKESAISDISKFEHGSTPVEQENVSENGITSNEQEQINDIEVKEILDLSSEGYGDDMSLDPVDPEIDESHGHFEVLRVKNEVPDEVLESEARAIVDDAIKAGVVKFKQEQKESGDPLGVASKKLSQGSASEDEFAEEIKAMRDQIPEEIANAMEEEDGQPAIQRPTTLDTGPKRKIVPDLNEIHDEHEIDTGSISTVSDPDIMLSVDELQTPEDLQTPEAMNNSSVFDGELDWESDTPTTPQPDTIPEYTYEEELEEDKSWRTVKIGGSQYRIDMKVIEPYKKVLSHGGYYGDGLNAIMVFTGCHLPDKSRRDYKYVMDNLFLYVVSTLELLVVEDYMIVYFHGATPSNKMPGLSWLKRCYQMIDRRLRKNLKGLLIVHPTFWLKTLVLMTRPFISAKFKAKLHYVRSLEDLSKKIPTEYVYVPDEVKQYDEKRFGSSSSEPPSPS